MEPKSTSIPTATAAGTHEFEAVMSSAEIRILLADDHTLVRRGVRLILESEPGLRVIAEAGDGAEAVAIGRSHEVDLAVLDVAMPG